MKSKIKYYMEGRMLPIWGLCRENKSTHRPSKDTKCQMPHIQNFFNVSPPLSHLCWLACGRVTRRAGTCLRNPPPKRRRRVFHDSIFSVWTMPPVLLGEWCKFTLNLHSICGEKRKKRQTSYFMEANGKMWDFERAQNSPFDGHAAIFQFIV